MQMTIQPSSNESIDISFELNYWSVYNYKSRILLALFQQMSKSKNMQIQQILANDVLLLKL